MRHTELRPNPLMLVWIIGLFIHKTDSRDINRLIQPDRVITADVGDNVTLHCLRLQEKSIEAVIWYKQKLGHEPRVMVTVHYQAIYEHEFQPPKFRVEKNITSLHLKITNVDPSDEAMYYCGEMQYKREFGKGTFLSVKGKPDLSVSVFQNDGRDLVPAGASVTLQCSVLSEIRTEELRVFWFRAAPPQSDPQIIYIHHNSSRQCERVTPTHTCVYNFSKNILSLNDTSTYYCAVALCGKIVLGNGTLVEIESVDPVVICLAVALGVCLVVQAILFYKWRNHEQSTTEGQGTGRGIEITSIEDLNYAALHFNEKKPKGGREKREGPQGLVYSEVRHHPKT